MDCLEVFFNNMVISALNIHTYFLNLSALLSNKQDLLTINAEDLSSLACWYYTITTGGKKAQLYQLQTQPTP